VTEIAFVETTVLADALLKRGVRRKAARAALARYTRTLLPAYAIREFRVGPLYNYCWLHNKLASSGSYAAALDALHSLSMTPRRYRVATALEALTAVAARFGKEGFEAAQAKHPEAQNSDALLANYYRTAVRSLVLCAWASRRKLTTDVVVPLACLPETAPRLRRGLLELEPRDCRPIGECSMAGEFRRRKKELALLRTANEKLPETGEQKRRGKALRALTRTPKREVTPVVCRNLGDAVFSLLAPAKAVILTTNRRDHEPLAAALGKSVETP